MLIGIFGVLNLLLFVLIFVPVAQRLLSVRFGLIRLILGAGLTLLVFTPMMNAMARSIPIDQQTSGITPLWFLMLAEAVVPTGSLPRLRDLRRDIGGRIARTRRYLQILRVATRHGLGPYL